MFYECFCTVLVFFTNFHFASLGISSFQSTTVSGSSFDDNKQNGVKEPSEKEFEEDSGTYKPIWTYGHVPKESVKNEMDDESLKKQSDEQESIFTPVWTYGYVPEISQQEKHQEENLAADKEGHKQENVLVRDSQDQNTANDTNGKQKSDSREKTGKEDAYVQPISHGYPVLFTPDSSITLPTTSSQEDAATAEKQASNEVGKVCVCVCVRAPVLNSNRVLKHN